MRAGRTAPLLGAVLLICGSGCTGLFQRPLPDAPFAYASCASGPELRVGAAEVDVTPAVGGYMAGFSLARRSVGVASPLRIRALVLELGGRRVAILGVDNLGLHREDVDWIKGGLAGFANGDVFVLSSHTHAGPDLIGLWGWYFLTSGRSRADLVQLRRAASEAVAAALAQAAPARLMDGQARMPAKGLVKNSNFADVFDRRIRVVHAVAVDDGRPLGTLLHLACHPEVLPRGNDELSSDFVGPLCDGWRQAGLGTAVFANGALGAMVSPAVRPRDQVGAARMGDALCALARQALAQAAPLPVDAIEVRRSDVFLPLQTFGLRLGRLTGAIPRELHQGHARTTVGYLRQGALQAVCLPGEVEPALAERIRARTHAPDLLVLSLCDDELGYLLREQDARDPEFAYERSMSACEQAGELVEAALLGPR